MYIKYYAPDSKLYPTESVEKDTFRLWAQTELEARYPTYTTSVLAVDNFCQVETDETDKINITDIQIYCSKLWLRWYSTQV